MRSAESALQAPQSKTSGGGVVSATWNSASLNSGVGLRRMKTCGFFRETTVGGLDEANEGGLLHRFSADGLRPRTTWHKSLGQLSACLAEKHASGGSPANSRRTSSRKMRRVLITTEPKEDRFVDPRCAGPPEAARGPQAAVPRCMRRGIACEWRARDQGKCTNALRDCCSTGPGKN